MRGIKQVSLKFLKNCLSGGTNTGDYIYVPDFKVDFPLTEPYRSDYYCIGLLWEGVLAVHTNLVRHELKAPSIIFADRAVIKSWEDTNEYHRAESILISDVFISMNLLKSKTFSFLSEVSLSGAFIAELTNKDVESVSALFGIINMHTPAPTKLHEEVVRGAVYSLISYIGSLYIRDRKTFTASNDLHILFYKAVSQYAIKQRNIGFYAKLLNVHPKYLGQVVKLRTGITAGEWIKRQVLLEAKVLLQMHNRSISEISDFLGFPDQSTFGKYFKKYTGFSPIAYRTYLEKLG